MENYIQVEKTKICTKCGMELDLLNFRKDVSKKYGVIGDDIEITPINLD